MSQYVNFFIKYNDIFIPIGNFSTNNYIKNLVNGFAPWGKVRAMSVRDINDFRELTCKEILKWEERKKACESLIRGVARFNNSAEDKLELIENIQFDIREYNKMIEEATIGEHFFMFLNWLIDAASVENANKYIYVGIEVGDNITVEDVIE